MTLPNTEIRVTPYGIPYVVEFANVSVGPRPPVVHADVIYHISDLVPKPSLSRSNTLPATSTPKPLPSIPLPVRSKSLKLFSRKTSFIANAKKTSAEEDLESRPVIRRNAAFAADARNSSNRHFKIFSASEETLVELEAARAVTLTMPMAPSEDEDGLSHRTGGLYIQFPTPLTTSDAPSETSSSPPIHPETVGPTQAGFEKATRSRLHRLSRAISKAVLAAGMEEPPRPTKKFETEESTGAQSGDARLMKTRQGLFKGTYGQVRAAFRAAGLVTTLCGEEGPEGVPDATRLGALFIANSDGRGGIVFTKVAMWA
ncbi:hypothetical protein BGW80DRAFT_1453746 [Lactifluus volemus]|nr:hypothetical protein BGW80DRAFT_1453746 [Lactifluus volemus]